MCVCVSVVRAARSPSPSENSGRRPFQSCLHCKRTGAEPVFCYCGRHTEPLHWYLTHTSTHTAQTSDSIQSTFPVYNLCLLHVALACWDLRTIATLCLDYLKHFISRLNLNGCRQCVACSPSWGHPCCWIIKTPSNRSVSSLILALLHMILHGSCPCLLSAVKWSESLEEKKEEEELAVVK